MKKIKHCPFCGGYGKIRKLGNGYAVRCSGCGATGQRVVKKEWHDSPCITQNLAIDAWNVRVEK